MCAIHVPALCMPGYRQWLYLQQVKYTTLFQDQVAIHLVRSSGRGHREWGEGHSHQGTLGTLELLLLKRHDHPLPWQYFYFLQRPLNSFSQSVAMAILNTVPRQSSTTTKPGLVAKSKSKSPAYILPTLPLEIVEMICDELDTRDLASLMGTCRDAYRLTIHRFAQRYTEIYTDLSQTSFDHIHAIASNAVMREYVQRLVILTGEPYLGNGVNWTWSMAGHVKNAVDMAVIKRLKDDLVLRLLHCRSDRKSVV